MEATLILFLICNIKCISSVSLIAAKTSGTFVSRRHRIKIVIVTPANPGQRTAAGAEAKW